MFQHTLLRGVSPNRVSRPIIWKLYDVEEIEQTNDISRVKLVHLVLPEGNMP
jgi:hypothetical protein